MFETTLLLDFCLL